MMSEADKGKIYGLIIPKKPGLDRKKASASAPAANFNIFGDDQDSDEEEKKEGPISAYGITKSSSKLKLQNQMDIEKAMMDDPSVYEYDEIYDDIQASKPQPGKQEEKRKKSQKPQYITSLLKAAEMRKKDQERRTERKVQKEREAEGEKFADKEAFVTSAYKQKMLERQREEEEERRKEQIEEMTDVTKQKDLGGFYRYLYRKTTDQEKEIKEDQGKDKSDSRVKSSPTSQLQIQKDDYDTDRRNYRQSGDSSSDESNSHKMKKIKGESKRHGKRPLSEEREYNNKQNSISIHSDTSGESHSPQQRITGDNSHSRKGTRRSRSSSSPEYKGNRDKKERKRDKSLSPSPSPPLSSKKRSSKNYRKKSRSRSGSYSHEESSHRDNVSKSHKKQRDSYDKETEGSSKIDIDDRKRKTSNDTTKENIKHVGKNKREERETSDDDDDDPGLTSQSNPIIKKPDTNNSKIKAPPVDPKDKVYPHHFSPKDIEEARKRYLKRKLEREKARGS